ncbi:MAG: hypothetical protein ABWX82_05385 [Leifsonia sp.]
MASIDAVHRLRLYPIRRLILGGVLVSGALGVAGFFFGSSSASAAEPAPVAPVTSAVSSLLPVLSDTVTTIVDDVAEAAPVASVVVPVAGAADTVVDAIPVVGDALGSTPASSVLVPVATGVDSALELPGEVLDEIAALPASPLPPSQPDGSADSIGATVLNSIAPLAPGSAVVAADRETRASDVAGPSRASVPAVDAVVVGVATSSPQGHHPFTPRDAGTPPAVPPGSSTSGGSAAASPGAPGNAADSGVQALIPDRSTDLLDLPADDRLPASAVAEHDTTPG